MNAPFVIFDFDGVIADTERLHLEALQHVLSPRGVELTLEQYESGYLGSTDHDLLIALPCLQTLSHQKAQVAGERSVRFVDRFILADHASQALADGAGARFQRRIGQALRRLNCASQARPQQHQQDRLPPHPACSLRTAGRTSRITRPGVSGPTQRCRIWPSRSIK